MTYSIGLQFKTRSYFWSYMIADLFLCSTSRLIAPGSLLPYPVFSLRTGSPTDYLVKCLLTLPDSSDGSDLGSESWLTVSQTDEYN